jgi:hypothetical protein
MATYSTGGQRMSDMQQIKLLCAHMQPKPLLLTSNQLVASAKPGFCAWNCWHPAELRGMHSRRQLGISEARRWKRAKASDQKNEKRRVADVEAVCGRQQPRCGIKATRFIPGRARQGATAWCRSVRLAFSLAHHHTSTAAHNRPHTALPLHCRSGQAHSIFTQLRPFRPISPR